MGHARRFRRSQSVPAGYHRCAIKLDDTEGLTSRCSRRLAGLFPPSFMISMLQEIASLALASRG